MTHERKAAIIEEEEGCGEEEEDKPN